MNPAMWAKALRIIPRLDKDEWDRLDFVSKWLIATRAAVLIMTFISAAIAGIFAFSRRPIQLRTVAAGDDRPGDGARHEQPAE